MSYESELSMTNNQTLQICPCCVSSMRKTGEVFQLYQIFEKWKLNGISISAKTFKDYPDNITMELFRCDKCEFGLFNPTITGSASFYKDVTSNDYYLNNRWDFQIAIKKVAHTLQKTILDVGCGQGAFLDLIHQNEKNIACHGLDTNPLVEKLPAHIKLHQSISTLPQNIDAITMFQVIEHISNPDAVFKDIEKSLKPGGLVFISAPDYSGPVRFFTDTHTALPPHHVSQWNPKCLKAFLERLGYEDLETIREPLPDYLFESYLPEIIFHFLKIDDKPVWKYRFKKYFILPLINILKFLKIKSLPLRGHTCLVIARKKA